MVDGSRLVDVLLVLSGGTVGVCWLLWCDRRARRLADARALRAAARGRDALRRAVG